MVAVDPPYLILFPSLHVCLCTACQFSSASCLRQYFLLNCPLHTIWSVYFTIFYKVCLISLSGISISYEYIVCIFIYFQFTFHVIWLIFCYTPGWTGVLSLPQPLCGWWVLACLSNSTPWCFEGWECSICCYGGC